MAAMQHEDRSPRFELGRCVATPGAIEALVRNPISAADVLYLHAQLDPGCLSKADWTTNLRALKDGGRILSAFQLLDGTRLWAITEARGGDGKRASTCLLLPEEY